MFPARSYLRLREWREDKINLTGATQSITVRVRYEKILPLLVLGTGLVQIRSATDASGHCNCGVGCAISRRNRVGRRPARLPANRCGNLINRYVRPEQTKGPPKALWISQPHCLFIDETRLLIDHQRDGKSTCCVLRGTLNREICSAFRSDHNRRLVAAAMASAKHRGKKYEQSKQGS